MTPTQRIVTIAICSIVTMATRFLPFLIFSSERPIPPYIRYLGKVLPPAIFGMLLVYCLKDVSLHSGAYGLPEAISITVVVLLHLWKRKTLLSIAAGTVCYMLLTQMVFV